MYFNSEQDFVIAEETTLNANGTVDQPIIMRGLQDEMGYWNGVQYNSEKAASVMNYVTISGAGYSDWWGGGACLWLDDGARLTLTNCTFTKSQYYGVKIYNIRYWSRITHSNNTFSQNLEGNVYISSGGEYNGTTYTDDQILPDLP